MLLGSRSHVFGDYGRNTYINSKLSLFLKKSRLSYKGFYNSDMFI